MRRVISTLQCYFFAPASPVGLGRSRVAFYLWLFLYYLPVVETFGSQNVSAFADIGDIFWQPVFPFDLVDRPRLPHPWIDLLVVTWKLSLFTSCVGLFTRVSMGVAFVLGTYTIGLPLNFGTVFHTGGAVVIALGIMALSRAGDAVSVDSWWQRRMCRPGPEAGGEYRWPIRFVWVLLATVYFSAGVSKWVGSGLAYLDPDVMASFLRQRAFASYQQPLTDWGYGLAAMPWVCTAMATWTLFAETGFVAALVSRRAALVLVPGMFLMHIGIAAVIGPQFFQFMSIYVFWIPWSREARGDS